MRQFKYLIILSVVAMQAYGVERVFYSPTARTIEVHSSETTLLTFPAPPIAVQCQPSNILSLEMIDKLSIEQTMALGGAVDGNSAQANQLSSDKADYTSKMLKLIPIARNGSATCSIKLSNTDTVNTVFTLNEKVARPIIEFSNMNVKGNLYPTSIKNMNGLQLFKDMLAGKPLNLIDISPSILEAKTKKTELGKYHVEYAMTDNKYYKSCKITLHTSQEVKKLPRLTKYGIGDIFYTAWIDPKEMQNISEAKENTDAHLYILSRQDLSMSEILEMLP